MQRVERDEPAQFIEYVIGDYHGLAKPRAAVNYPVADRAHVGQSRLPFELGDQVADGVFIVRRAAGQADALDRAGQQSAG